MIFALASQFHLSKCESAFNQEKALVGALSVIVKLQSSFEALETINLGVGVGVRCEVGGGSGHTGQWALAHQSLSRPA